MRCRLQNIYVTYTHSTVFLYLYLYTLIIYSLSISLAELDSSSPFFALKKLQHAWGFALFLMILSSVHRIFIFKMSATTTLIFSKFKQRYLSAVKLVKVSYFHYSVGHDKKKRLQTSQVNSATKNFFIPIFFNNSCYICNFNIKSIIIVEL